MNLLVSILGEVEYGEALELQKKLLQLRQQDKIDDVLLLLEHSPTLTLGTRENRENIIAAPAQLKKNGINIHKTNRGGDVTYHGPGQVVGYCILDLKNHGKSIKVYINKLEEMFIQLLKDKYNITAVRDEKHRGVWIDQEKITAIGCAVKKTVTMHGFAFNVNTNLDHFKLINPCGITDRGVTSLQKLLGQTQNIQQVHEQIIAYFSKVFNTQAKYINPQQLTNIINQHI